MQDQGNEKDIVDTNISILGLVNATIPLIFVMKKNVIIQRPFLFGFMMLGFIRFFRRITCVSYAKKRDQQKPIKTTENCVRLFLLPSS